METILFINACPRENSRTLELAKYALSKLEGEVTELPLFEENLLPLNQKTLALRDKLIAAEKYDHPLFKYARQLIAADRIVLAAPFWDLSFPSVVKVYIEYLMALGLTFGYTEDGLPRGNCKAQQLILISTAGGPVGQVHLGFAYLKALAERYFGIPETVCFCAEQLDIVGADVAGILAQTKNDMDNYWRQGK